MIIEKHPNNIYSMDSLTFSANGTDFLITGTFKTESGEYKVDVKNLTNGKTKQFDHQRLCLVILKSQEKEEASEVSRPDKYRQTGLNL